MDKFSRFHKLKLVAYRQINHPVIFWEVLIISNHYINQSKNSGQFTY